MTRSRLFLLAIALWAASTAAPTAALAADSGTTYTLDPVRSRVYVQIFKDTTTVGSDLSHDHVVLATGWTGTATLSPTDPAVCSVDVVVPVSGLRPDQPELRQKVGYTVMLTDAQQAQVAEHMVGSDQLNAASFSDIRFRATSCSGSAAVASTGTASIASRTVTGQLTIHGVSKTVQVPIRVTFDGASLHITGAFSAVHEDFGFTPYTALLGTLRNQAGLNFTLDVVGAAR